MKIKLKKENKDGVVRVESGGTIREVLINEDILNPGAEMISLCFRGTNSSGIIDLSAEEFEKLYFSVKDRMHLIKGLKRLDGDGAVKH